MTMFRYGHFLQWAQRRPELLGSSRLQAAINSRLAAPEQASGYTAA